MPENTTIIFREYDLNYNKRLKMAKEIKKIARKNHLTLLIGKNIKLAKEIKADGVHFSDQEKSWRKYLRYKKNNKKLTLSCSCHNEPSIKKANKLLIDIKFISPIFLTKSYSENQTIGTKKLSKIIKNNINQNIIPLGGVNSLNIKLLQKIKINSMAGISFFNTFN